MRMIIQGQIKSHIYKCWESPSWYGFGASDEKQIMKILGGPFFRNEKKFLQW